MAGAAKTVAPFGPPIRTDKQVNVRIARLVVESGIVDGVMGVDTMVGYFDRQGRTENYGLNRNPDDVAMSARAGVA